MYIERIDNHPEKAGRFSSGQKKRGVIFFSGKFRSFLDDLDPEVLLNREQAESFFMAGKLRFEKWSREQNQKVEDKHIFNLLFQMVLTGGGRFEIFCYKPAGLMPVQPYCFYRAGKSIKDCEILQEGDVVALSTGNDLEFPDTTEPDNKTLSRFIVFEIKTSSFFSGGTSEETEVVREKGKTSPGKILTGTLILLLAGGYIYFNNSRENPLVKQNEEPVSSLPAAVIINDIDQDLSLIDRRIAEGKYLQASEIIEKWQTHFKQNPEKFDNKDTALMQRIRQLDHFKSLLAVSDDDEL